MTITPTTSGDFGIVCNEFCGLGHHTMTGRIYVVEPQLRSTAMSIASALSAPARRPASRSTAPRRT